MDNGNKIKVRILQKAGYNETCRKRNLHIAENCLQQKTFMYSAYLHERGTCRNRKKKNSVLCYSVVGRFRCVSRHIPLKYALESRKMGTFISCVQTSACLPLVQYTLLF
jgi:hypothetical protein